MGEWKCNKCGKYHWSTIKVCECGQTFEQNEKELKDRQQQIKAEGKIEIPFSSFYDLRKGNFFKDCFVEIHKA